MATGQLTLFLIPYAGGSAGVFRDWNRALPAWIRPIPINLPGRGVRHGEPLLHEWPPLVDLLTAEIHADIDGPFAVFGHSLGALIGLELAQAVRARHGKSPVWLGASGCTAPAQHKLELKWLDCPEGEFLEKLHSLQGTPPELLANREMLDLVMPILRADFHLAGSYQMQKRPPLTMPIQVLGGTQDTDVVEPRENLSAWRNETIGPVRIELIEAGHFFLETHRGTVIDNITSDLSLVLRHQERANA